MIFLLGNNNSMKKTKKRENWIDVLKGIGMIYVLMGHIKPSLFFEIHIYSFHMPLFFFISGYLYNNYYPFNIYLKRKIKSLLIPYIIFAFFALLVSAYFNGSFFKLIEEFLFLNGTVGWNSPIWFLIVLFITEIIYYL